MQEMTRTQKLEYIIQILSNLSDESVDAVSALMKHVSDPTVYSSLPEIRKAKIEQAMARWRSAQGISAQQAFPAIAHKLQAKGLPDYPGVSAVLP